MSNNTLGIRSKAIFDTLKKREVLGEGSIDPSDEDDIVESFESIVPYLSMGMNLALWLEPDLLDELKDSPYFAERFKASTTVQTLSGVVGFFEKTPLIVDSVFAATTRQWSPLKEGQVILLQVQEEQYETMCSH